MPCAAALAGEHAAIYTFDESTDTLFARSDAIGLPIRKQSRRILIRIQQIDPAEMSPGRFAHEVRTHGGAEHCACRRDRQPHGLSERDDRRELLVNQLHELLSSLGQNGIVTLLVATQHGLIGTAMQTPVDVSYLADTVVMLRYFEARGSVHNAISVVKKRSGRHERTIHQFGLSAAGIHVGEAIAGIPWHPHWGPSVQIAIGGFPRGWWSGWRRNALSTSSSGRCSALMQPLPSAFCSRTASLHVYAQTSNLFAMR